MNQHWLVLERIRMAPRAPYRGDIEERNFVESFLRRECPEVINYYVASMDEGRRAHQPRFASAQGGPGMIPLARPGWAAALKRTPRSATADFGARSARRCSSSRSRYWRHSSLRRSS